MRKTTDLQPLAQRFARSSRWAMIGTTIALAVSACELAEILPTEPVDPEEPAPTVARVSVSPGEVQIDPDSVESWGMEAKAFDAEGNEIAMAPSDFTWLSSDEGIAAVDSVGQVTPVAEGDALITAALATHQGSATVRIQRQTVAPDPEPEDPPAPSGWDSIVQDTLVVGNVTVPEGETWLFGANVEVEGNVIVEGTLAMRPGSSLKFLGADPDRYVGGGMMWDPTRFQSDIGLWVVGTGALDIQGTPKKGWTRTGSHPTWEPSDEYYIAPTDRGDTEVRRWYPGNPVPRIDPRVPAAEVVNVSRDIVIEGPGHIHIHSERAQRIEYVQLRSLGVSNSASKGAVLGRYALHLHHGLDGVRGTSIRGVAAVNSRGKVFVPHMSHGVTMVDNVSVNSLGEGLWWDVGDDTNDLLVDSMAVLGVHMPRSLTDRIPWESAYVLGSGINMEIRNSVAAGANGSKLARGFSWTDGGRTPNPEWTFEQGNVAHNNGGPGARFWTNVEAEHVVKDFVSYRNSIQDGNDRNAGVETGAYAANVLYEDALILDGHLFQQANARVGAGYRNVVVEAIDGPALVVGHRNLPGDAYLMIEDCTLTPAPGHPIVLIKRPTDFTRPWKAHFKRCGLTPDDVVFESLSGGNDGSHILIDHADGRRWEIRAESGRKIVRSR